MATADVDAVVGEPHRVVVDPLAVDQIHTHGIAAAVGLEAQENRLGETRVGPDAYAQNNGAAHARGDDLAVPPDRRTVAVPAECRVLEGDGVRIKVRPHVHGAVLGIVIADVDRVGEQIAAGDGVGTRAAAHADRAGAVHGRTVAAVHREHRSHAAGAAVGGRCGARWLEVTPVAALAHPIPLMALEPRHDAIGEGGIACECSHRHHQHARQDCCPEQRANGVR